MVFGGFFDDKFKEFTEPLCDHINEGEFTIKFSTLLEEDLKLAPEKVGKLVLGIDQDDTEFITEIDNAVELATDYVSEKVVVPTSYSDCLHIALTTINQAYLLNS